MYLCFKVSDEKFEKMHGKEGEEEHITEVKDDRGIRKVFVGKPT
jgi:hypothetical protein